MNLTELNSQSEKACIEWFMQSCTAHKWCQLMARSRPFAGVNEVLRYAGEHWQKMAKSDVLEALAGHPMIGDISSLREKYASTRHIAAHEQSGMQQADDKLYARLKQLNDEYLQKHGFIFIICASGLSAQTLLNAIELRVNNSTKHEYETAASEQHKITHLRLTKALNAEQ